MSAIPELCAKAAEAEIERLRRTVNDLKSGWQSTYDHDTNWLKSEIERLRAAMEVRERDHREKTAEIERLRADMQTAAKLNLELMEIRRTNEAEIDRLRELLGNSEQLKAEIRGRKVELDSLRKDFGDLYDEVERLRALVRDIYDRHDLGSALDARMREALGE